jgi:DNA-binding PadR family transcriptional regulator
MAKRSVSNPLALAVLALLTEGPTHPYDLARTLRERRKEQSIKLNYGSLYTVIEQLVRAGFVRVEGTERPDARPERTVYGLTEPGRFELHDWLADLITTPHKEFTRFEAALALMGVLPPDEGLRLLAVRVDRLKAQIRALEAEMEVATQGGLHPLFLVESEYRLALDRAELAFVQDLLARARTDDAYGRPWREHHQGRSGGPSAR